MCEESLQWGKEITQKTNILGFVLFVQMKKQVFNTESLTCCITFAVKTK